MAKKKTPKYLKILEGMNCCYGGLDERDCGSCPYDKYNDRGYYGEGGAGCMIKLNADAKKWVESMSMFTNCGNCCMYRDGWTDADTFEYGRVGKDGWCGQWNTVMCPDEYCSRGAMKE